MAMVRRYRIADKPACLAIFDSNVRAYFDASERDDFAAFLDDPDGEYLVLEQDGAVIGCGGYAREERGQARFTWGMVDGNHHGAGHGQRLAEYRLQKIAASGDFAETELFTTPKVAPFFAKFGFAEAEIVKDGFAPGMDKVQMIRDMSECAGD